MFLAFSARFSRPTLTKEKKTNSNESPNPKLFSTA
jgi:hypothetical protein